MNSHASINHQPPTLHRPLKKVVFVCFRVITALLLCPRHATAQERPFELDSVNKLAVKVMYQDPDSALQLIRVNAEKAMKANWLAGVAHIRVFMFDAYFRKGAYQEAIGALEENRKLYLQWIDQVQGDDKQRIRMFYGESFHQMAKVYTQQGKYEAVPELCDKALEIYSELDYYPKTIKKREVRANETKAIAYYFQGDLDRTLDLMIEGLAISREIANPSNLAVALSNIATVYLDKGNHAKALDYNFQAYDIAKKEGLKGREGNTLGKIGMIYYQQQEYDKALDYSLQAGRIAEEVDNKYDIAYYAINAADSYRKLGKTDSAQYLYQLSLALNEEMENIDDQAFIYERLAGMLIDQNEFQEALEIIERGLKLVDGTDIFEEQLLLQAGKVTTLLGLNENQSALKAVSKLENLAEQTDNFSHQSDAYKAIHQAYFANGQNGKAYDFLLKFNMVQDSLNNEEKARDLARVEYKYELDKERNKAQAEQEKQELVFRQALEKERWIQYSAFGGLALVLIIIVILFRSYRIKQSDNKRLADQNTQIRQLRDSEKKMSEETIALKERELTTITMLSHERNSLLEELNTQIGALSSKVDEDVIPELKGIRKTISANLNEESWSLFTYHFENVHPRFFNSLKESYSSLTQNDLRLCAYVRVGMSNKEIANISNITADAVKKSLQRMKKKMSLTVQDDLRAFLMSL